MTKIISAWERTLSRRGDERAIVEAASGATRTFRELDAGAVAWGMNSAALKGRPVVFALPNGIRWMEFFLAIVRAGGVAVPLDAAEPLASQRQIAEAVRAGFWFDGARFLPLPNARRFRAPDVALIKLTSGTTGRPRALVFTDEQMLADARQVTVTMGIRASDLNYALIPFGHSYGLGNLTFPLLAHGVPIVCGSAPLPHAMAGDFARWHPTVLPSVPAVYRALVESDIAPAALTSLRVAISAGAPLPPETARAFEKKFHRRIHAFYGSSETGGIAYDRSGGATLEGGVGTAMRAVTISLARGGRLRVCSAAVFTHGNRHRSRKFGCWSPADRAHVDGRGRITLLGRRGTTVKISGRRVNLAEVAARLRAIPGVDDVWVGASTSAEPFLGAALATTRSAAEVRSALLADTAAWKVPKRWAVLRKFPVTERGKTDTRALHHAVFGSL